MVFYGMEQGQGFNAYENNVQVASKRTKSQYTSPKPAIGELFVGRRMYTVDSWYVTAEIDEIAIFDKVLSADEVQSLYDMYSPHFP